MRDGSASSYLVSSRYVNQSSDNELRHPDRQRLNLKVRWSRAVEPSFPHRTQGHQLPAQRSRSLYKMSSLDDRNDPRTPAARPHLPTLTTNLLSSRWQFSTTTEMKCDCDSDEPRSTHWFHISRSSNFHITRRVKFSSMRW